MESRPQDNPYSDPFHLYSAKPSADGQHVPQTVDYLQLHSDLPFDLSHEDIQNVLGNFDPPNPTQAGGCSEAAGCSAQSSETVTSLTGSKEIMLVLTDIKEGILELQAQFGNMKSELSSVQSHCAAFASEISEIRNLYDAYLPLYINLLRYHTERKP